MNGRRQKVQSVGTRESIPLPIVLCYTFHQWTIPVISFSTTASSDRRPEIQSKRGKKGQQNPHHHLKEEEVAFYVSSHKKLPHIQKPETPAYHCFIIVITLLSPPHRQPLLLDSDACGLQTGNWRHVLSLRKRTTDGQRESFGNGNQW